MLIDVLINTNMYGRDSDNNFTSVSTNGRAVVDYCFVSHAGLKIFSKFSVTRSFEFINQSGCLSKINPSSIPHHSLLKWKVEMSRIVTKPTKSASAQSDQSLRCALNG